MSEKDDKNLVDLKNWKREKDRAEKQKARAKGSTGGTINTSSALAQKIAMALFILVVLWFSMPRGYIAAIRQSLGL